MWTKSKSILLSQALVIVAFLICTAFIFFMPSMRDFCMDVIEIHDRNVDSTIPVSISMLINLYTALVPAFVAFAVLYKLLLNIKTDRIFYDSNVKLLRILSYCCFAETLIFIVFAFLCSYGIYGVSFIALLVSFVAAFFGLILRVIKNVFEKAIEIREENDFTI